MDIRNEMEVLRQLIYNGKAGVRRLARPTYQRPYPAYIDDLPFPREFEVPSFSLFNGEDLYASTLENIGRFSTQCVAIETQPILKLSFFGSSLSGQAFSCLEPEVIINDLTK
ncbi:hypothetical protein L3X38_001695 [Prunus dulcis]|uniref:Uncharacterized protein n=1 Tax=Prunus dulcis TaxID=3755 RepID=A0AAD4WT11_PRUDU|nr:hypothetical protein L3X38_001695 [Prunus dulcis]